MTLLAPSRRRRAAGVALPVVLMFMLVITVVAGFGVRRAVLGEGVSRNQLDYEVARQAAEAALRDAERELFQLGISGATCSRAANRPLRDAIKLPYWDVDCPNGQCYTTADALAAAVWGTPASGVHAWWPGSAGGLWGNPTAAEIAACNFKGGVPLGTFTGTPAVAGVARQPEYLIEFIQRPDDPRLRVTARGFRAGIRTEVVVDSYYSSQVFSDT